MPEYLKSTISSTTSRWARGGDGVIPVEIIEWMIKCMLIMVFVVPIVTACVLFVILACWLQWKDNEEENACEQG